MNWLPIETAPKDVDILVIDIDGYIDIARWECYMPEGYNWAHARCVDGLHLCEKQTHWMPLPQPPNLNK